MSINKSIKYYIFGLFFSAIVTGTEQYDQLISTSGLCLTSVDIYYPLELQECRNDGLQRWRIRSDNAIQNELNFKRCLSTGTWNIIGMSCDNQEKWKSSKGTLHLLKSSNKNILTDLVLVSGYNPFSYKANITQGRLDITAEIGLGQEKWIWGSQRKNWLSIDFFQDYVLNEPGKHFQGFQKLNQSFIDQFLLSIDKDKHLNQRSPWLWQEKDNPDKKDSYTCICPIGVKLCNTGKPYGKEGDNFYNILNTHDFLIQIEGARDNKQVISLWECQPSTFKVFKQKLEIDFLYRKAASYGNTEKAIELLENILLTDIKHFSTWRRLCFISTSSDACDEALKIKPDDPISWLGKGIQLRKQGEFNKALDAYDKALTLDQTNYYIWFEKAVTLLFKKQYSDSLNMLDSALKLSKDNSFIWYWKGFVHKLNKSPEKARLAFKQSFQIDPTNDAAKYYLGQL
ncbi:tetratricopeptide repeat protein [Spartinivicinus poritis]|uniref:Tetratricopeptide repeat protein n=1 Tax=Spartinivicinus poritis TaxID=2994640 RepID=A0ABT5UF43_9GAMM|nr:tetratricopeptide repeat protein [Spartinivicinus sp. A2-2]MDE1464127.1 hypothetical protein [Spartinivicinus sp. A2-2]